jgi:membrane protease YdiL (CAAX protease family)
MAKTLGTFRAALLIGWLVLTAAGVLYARIRSIPSWAAVPALAAFLLEYPFYLVPAFPELRKRLARPLLLPFLVGSVLVPYIACYAAIGHLQLSKLLELAAFTLVVSVWYLVLPVNMAVDSAFLALLGFLLLSGYYERIYVSFYPALPIAILGRLALFRTAAMVLMLQRLVPETGYGFLPNGREWRIGLLHYLYFLPAAACLALPLGAVHFASPAPLWKTIGIFLAFLWVVALFEEFFFRGILQPWLVEWTGNRAAGLLFASLLFGVVHLWFRAFPNWRWALLAAVLGWFCGHARNQADSIRASMVTHALAVATWRGFFV